MKFIVKGKSADFKNREGSSPSIPLRLLNIPMQETGDGLGISRVLLSCLNCHLPGTIENLTKKNDFLQMTLQMHKKEMRDQKLFLKYTKSFSIPLKALLFFSFHTVHISAKC